MHRLTLIGGCVDKFILRAGTCYRSVAWQMRFEPQRVAGRVNRLRNPVSAFEHEQRRWRRVSIPHLSTTFHYDSISAVVMDCHGLQCELTRLKPRVNHGNSCGRIWCQSGRSRAKWWCSLALGSGIRTRLRRRFAEDWQCALGLPHKFGCNLQIFEPTAAINHRSTAQCWLNRQQTEQILNLRRVPLHRSLISFINIVH